MSRLLLPAAAHRWVCDEGHGRGKGARSILPNAHERTHPRTIASTNVRIHERTHSPLTHTCACTPPLFACHPYCMSLLLHAARCTCAFCTPHAARRMLHAACCMLHAACCMFPWLTARCAPHAALCALPVSVARFTLRAARCSSSRRIRRRSDGSAPSVRARVSTRCPPPPLPPSPHAHAPAPDTTKGMAPPTATADGHRRRPPPTATAEGWGDVDCCKDCDVVDRPTVAISGVCLVA
jgi:hypothetical protein